MLSQRDLGICCPGEVATVKACQPLADRNSKGVAPDALDQRFAVDLHGVVELAFEVGGEHVVVPEMVKICALPCARDRDPVPASCDSLCMQRLGQISHEMI